MTPLRHNVAKRAQVLGLLIALFAVSVTASAQDLSSQEVERILREKPTLLNEEGTPIERRLDPESYIPNELIVRFQSGTLALPQGQYRAAPSEVAARPGITALFSSSGVAEVRKAFRNFQATDTLRTLRSGEQVRVPDLSQVVVLEFATPVDVPALIEQFEALPDVLYAEPNHLYEFSVVPTEAVLPFISGSSVISPVVVTSPNDPHYGEQWALEQSAPHADEDIDAETAWGYETGDYGVKIGIVDTGINYNHQDLGAAYGLGYKVVGGYDWYSNDANPIDENSHGSHVAGIAGALTNNTDSGGGTEGIAGVAGGWGYNRQTGSGNKGAQLFALKIGGAGPSVDAEAGAAAIVEGSDPDGDGWGYGIDVLNNSWGGTGSQFYSETVRSAFNYAARMGSVVTAAKGNNDSGTINYPSDYDGSWVISVGATTRDGRRATPADWGAPFGSNYGNGIDAAAPGTSILSTVLGQGYGDKSGTSMAAPHVTGLAALLIGEARSQGITLHPEDVQGLIRASADDKGAPGYDDYFGAGRINAGRALEMVQDPWNFRQTFALGGSVTSSTDTYAALLLNSVTGSAGTYIVKRHEVRKTSSFSLDYSGTPHVWCRGANETIGWSAANPNYQTGYCKVLSNTANSVDLQTYVYQIWTINGSYLGYYPTTPQNVRLEYTTLGQVAPLNAGISGPTSIPSGTSGTWTRSVSGGDSPYSYTWEYKYPCPGGGGCEPYCGCAPYCVAPGGGGNESSLREAQPSIGRNGGVVTNLETCGVWLSGGTGATFTKTFSGSSVTIKLTVTDAAATVDTATREVTLTGGAQGGGEQSATTGPASDAMASTAESGAVPAEPSLTGVRPNPFNPVTVVQFSLPEAQEARIAVYDMLGREVAVLTESRLDAGPHEVHFDADSLPSGVYLVRMVAGVHVSTQRITLLR